MDSQCHSLYSTTNLSLLLQCPAALNLLCMAACVTACCQVTSSTCSAMAYVWGLSSPKGTPRYCVIMRAP